MNELRKKLSKSDIQLEDDTPPSSSPRKKIKSGTKTIKVSPTDEDASYYFRDEKEKGFVYQDNRVVEAKNNFIIASCVQPGHIHDSKVIENVLTPLENRGIHYKNRGLDSGYNSLEIMRYFKKLE